MLEKMRLEALQDARTPIRVYSVTLRPDRTNLVGSPFEMPEELKLRPAKS